MAIADDFSIALNGDIRWTGTSATYTVLEFHRFLQDNADNASAATADDLINISSDDPSARATDNIITLQGAYNITDTEAEHLYDGSIRQGSGATEDLYGGLVVVGTVGAATTELIIIQNDTVFTNYWGTGLNDVAAEQILLRLCFPVRKAGLDIDGRRIIVQAREQDTTGADTYAEFGVTLGNGNATAAIFTADDINAETSTATLATYDQFGNIEGFQAIDIDPGFSPESYYHQWDRSSGSTPASPTLNDLWEYTKYITRRGTAETIHGRNGSLFRGITHEIDWDGQGANPFVENEYAAWGTTLAWDGSTGDFTVGEKLTFDVAGSNNGPITATLLALQDDGTSGVMVVAVEGTAVITDNDTIDGATSGADALVDGATRLVDHNPPVGGGEGLILADDDQGTTGTMWIQLVKGVAPVDNLPLHGHDRTSWLAANAVEAAVNVTVNSFAPDPEFLGTFTGSAIIGGYGIGMLPAETGASDLFDPLEAGTAQPPDNRTWTLSGVVTGDRILVGPNGTGDFDKAQMLLNANLTGVTTTIVMQSAIPDNTPAAGTIRVVDDLGAERRLTYTSFSGSTFSGVGGDNDFTAPDDATAGNGAYVTYLDLAATGTSESFNYVFSSDSTLRFRVREGTTATPIQTAEGTATFSSGGATVNRISDL